MSYMLHNKHNALFMERAAVTGAKKRAEHARVDIAAKAQEMVEANVAAKNARKIDASRALAFILGGHAFVTLRSTKTGTRFTYRITAHEKEPLHFVSLLTGPENTSDYAFLGTIFKGRAYVHGRKSKISASAPGALAFEWTIRRLLAGHFPATVEVWHSGRCCVCGRPLTTPESIESGIGPVCEKKF